MGEVDRGVRSIDRARKAFQALSEGFGTTYSPPLAYDDDTSTVTTSVGSGIGVVANALVVSLSATTPCLSTTSGLTLVVDTNFGLSLNAAGARVDLASNPGLEFFSGDLRVSLSDTTPCLSMTSGLTLVVDTNFGLSLNAAGARVDLASNPGLEFSSGDLRLDANFIRVSGTTSMAFFGNAAIARPGAFAIVNAPAVSDNLDADANAGAYTGIDNAQAGTVYAQVSDLNDLRADVASSVAVLRSLIRHLGDDNGLGLVAETGY